MRLIAGFAFAYLGVVMPDLILTGICWIVAAKMIWTAFDAKKPASSV